MTDPSNWPGMGDQRTCVQNAFDSYCVPSCAYPGYPGNCIPCDVGCDTWRCACNQFTAAPAAVSSVAITACRSQMDGVASVTSILNGFCAQLLATPSLNLQTSPNTQGTSNPTTPTTYNPTTLTNPTTPTSTTSNPTIPTSSTMLGHNSLSHSDIIAIISTLVGLAGSAIGLYYAVKTYKNKYGNIGEVGTVTA